MQCVRYTYAQWTENIFLMEQIIITAVELCVRSNFHSMHKQKMQSKKENHWRMYTNSNTNTYANKPRIILCGVHMGAAKIKLQTQWNPFLWCMLTKNPHTCECLCVKRKRNDSLCQSANEALRQQKQQRTFHTHALRYPTIFCVVTVKHQHISDEALSSILLRSLGSTFVLRHRADSTFDFKWMFIPEYLFITLITGHRMTYGFLLRFMRGNHINRMNMIFVTLKLIMPLSSDT